MLALLPLFALAATVSSAPAPHDQRRELNSTIIYHHHNLTGGYDYPASGRKSCHRKGGNNGTQPSTDNSASEVWSSVPGSFETADARLVSAVPTHGLAVVNTTSAVTSRSSSTIKSTVKSTSSSKSSLKATSTSKTTSSAKPASSKVSSTSKAASSSIKTSSSVATTTSAGNSVPSGYPQTLLTLHNNFRKQYGAGPLTWDPVVAQYAQTQASKCVFAHSNGQYGENLAAGVGGGYDATAGFNSWAAEAAKYDYDNPVFGMDTGHFTQVVWKSTTKLGCAVVNCPAGSIFPASYNAPNVLVWCNYQTPGNYQGQFAQNVGRKTA